MKRLIFSGLLVLTSCTTANQVYGTDGQKEVLIACGASVPSSVCFDRAAKECPKGYTLRDQQDGFNRREVRVRCKE